MFHVGQRVVCVDDSPIWTDNKKPLRKNAVYTVTAVLPPTLGRTGPNTRSVISGIQVAEVKMEQPNDWFAVHRFRPAVERKTDISLFTAMLNTKKQKERA